MKVTASIVIFTLGCVWAGPVDSYDDYDPNTENVYHLFTRSNPTVSQPLLYGNTALLITSNLNLGKRTAVIIHGANSSVNGDMTYLLVPALLQASDINVLAVDWERGAWLGNDFAIPAGQATANFFNWVNTTLGRSLDLHMIGFSRGAHHAGIASRNVNGGVVYLTGLDPSPGFAGTGIEIQKSDANYTEIIWSSVPGVASGNVIGPYGDVDFYPNRGHYQPGCGGWLCDHFRAVHFFAESVVSGGFTGTECATLQEAIVGDCNLPGRMQMGQINPSPGASGLFFLTTNSVSPFSIY